MVKPLELSPFLLNPDHAYATPISVEGLTELELSASSYKKAYPTT
jgi:hypothetical protein